MIIEALLHVPESKFCFAVGEKEIALRLRTAKNENFSQVNVVYEGKYNFGITQKRIEMKKTFSCKNFDYYTVNIKLTDVRFVYIFEIIENGKTWFFSEDGVSDRYDYKLGYYNCFQLPYINKIDLHRVVPWMREAVFYEIFPDRFYRGDMKKNSSYINLEWNEIPNPKSFAGGDIRGIIEKLDYIKELGISALYLTPIFKSNSNHKYDTIDYYDIDPHFGSKADFAELVKKAHARGIRIVLDAVFNHSSNLTTQFKDVLKKGKYSKFYNWFIINGDKPTVVDDISNYESFAACVGMPKLNTSNVHMQKFLLDIATHWIKKYDIDGWRLDVGDEVSHDFWRIFKKSVKAAKEDAVIIGENWHDANSFLQGDQYDSVMNYAFTKACMDYYAYNVFSAKDFAEKLSALIMRNTDQVNTMMLNLLDSHDTHRFYSLLNCNKNKLMSALCVVFMFLGAPCVYYGTEMFMEGGYDPDCRRTFDWDMVNTNSAIYKQIQSLAALKRTDTLKNGAISFSSENDVFIMERYTEKQKYTLMINNSNTEKDIKVNGKIVLQNNYKNSKLLADGYIIMEV